MESNQQVKNSSEKQNLSLQSSPSSSPSHDFSFTISLSSSSKLTTPTKTTSSHQQQQQTVDLSPADDIFFHGHLLPLHLLSHISPRTSTASIINDGSSSITTTTTKEPISNNNNITTRDKADIEISPVKTKPNNKSFSLFGLSKWRKGIESNERESEQQQKKKLMSLDLSHTVKKYIRMLFQKRGNGTQFMNKRQTNPSSYSFSSSLMSSSKGISSNKRDLITRRPHGELFSAPASMRTSPTNSGHLKVSTAGLMTPSSGSTSSSSSDSTMEELQAAIQAAIAHCKNSCTVDRC